MSAEPFMYQSALDQIERSRRLRAELAALRQQTVETIAHAKDAIVSLFAVAREARRQQEAWRDLRRRDPAITGEKIVELAAWRARRGSRLPASDGLGVARKARSAR